MILIETVKSKVKEKYGMQVGKYNVDVYAADTLDCNGELFHQIYISKFVGNTEVERKFFYATRDAVLDITSEYEIERIMKKPNHYVFRGERL